MNRKQIAVSVFTLILLMATGVIAAEHSNLTGAKNFYQDKTLHLICPFSVGGGYDREFRIAKPFFDKYMPGIKIVIENVPGGGGNVGTNLLYKAKPDGLTFGVVAGGGITSGPIAGDPGVRYDPAKFVYLGSLFGEERIIAVRSELPIHNVKDLMNYDQQLRMPFKAKGGASYITAQLLNRVFPTKVEIKSIFGFPGSAEEILALRRGEVDLDLGSQSSLVTQIRDGVVRPLYLVAEHTPKDLPADLPNLWYPKGQQLVPEKAKPFLVVAVGIVKAGRPLVAPPGTPADRALFLESVIQKIGADPKFIEMASKLGSTVSGSNGAAIRESVMSVLNAPADIKQIIKDVY